MTIRFNLIPNITQENNSDVIFQTTTGTRVYSSLDIFGPVFYILCSSSQASFTPRPSKVISSNNSKKIKQTVEIMK